jgi:hypothetical protein
MAASATFALKAGLCIRRARRVIVTPDRRHSRRSQADLSLIELSEFARPPLNTYWHKANKVRALVRNREKTANWANQSVELVDGDWNDSAAIEQALKGVEGAFIQDFCKLSSNQCYQ